MLSPSIQQQRAKIIEEISHIDSMIRGHLSQQTLKPKRSSGTASYGPYYTLQRHENGTIAISSEERCRPHLSRNADSAIDSNPSGIPAAIK